MSELYNGEDFQVSRDISQKNEDTLRFKTMRKGSNESYLKIPRSTKSSNSKFGISPWDKRPTVSSTSLPAINT